MRVYRRVMRRILFPLLALLAFVEDSARAADAPIIRDPGVLYLADFNEKPLKLKVLKEAPGYFTREMTRYLGTLRPGQAVEVQALDEKAYRVKGRAQQGQVLAWVSPEYLEAIPEGLVENLRKSEERRREVDALIAEHEVAIGMTTDEVGRSLGKPDKKTARRDKQKTEQVWEYVRYKQVPQQSVTTLPNGQAAISTIYVKVPIGRLSVQFEEDLVTSLEQSEGTISEGNKVQVVARPVVVYW